MQSTEERGFLLNALGFGLVIELVAAVHADLSLFNFVVRIAQVVWLSFRDIFE